MPYDLADPVELYIFSVRSQKNFGQFIFPKTVLCEKGIISKNGKGGKRATRLYPPWVIAPNLQAKNTQKWQTNYFFEIPLNKPMASPALLKLFNEESR